MADTKLRSSCNDSNCCDKRCCERGKRGKRGHHGATGPTGPEGPSTNLLGPTTGPAVLIAAEDIPVGSVIAPGSAVRAIASTDGSVSPSSRAIGIATSSVLTGEVTDYIAAGPVVLDTAIWDTITGGTGGLIPNSPYYLSQTSPGGMTDVKPDTGQIVVLGWALSDVVFNFGDALLSVSDGYAGPDDGPVGPTGPTGPSNGFENLQAYFNGYGVLGADSAARMTVDSWQLSKLDPLRGDRGYPGGTGNENAIYIHRDKHSVAIGANSRAPGKNSFAQGSSATASGEDSHAEGRSTTASGDGAHAEGVASNASGFGAHAEGSLSTASGSAAHAEGLATTASSGGAHAEGVGPVASGGASHAEGHYTIASGTNSHAEGDKSHALRYGQHAHSSVTVDEAPFPIGSIQTSALVLFGRTPGTPSLTAVELRFGDFGDTPGGEPLVLEDGKTYAFKITAACGGVQGLNLATRALELSFNVNRGGGLSTIQGAQITNSYGTANAVTWTLAASIGAAPDRVVLTFSTGAGLPSVVNVAAKVEFTEVVIPIVIP